MILDEAPTAVTIELPPLPEAWVARLGAILEPAALGPALASFALEKPTCLRANELKATADQVASELARQEFDLEPLGWCPGAWWIPAGQKRRLTDSDAFQQGRIYVQNPSSLLPPLVLAPVPGEEVLDLAAAPGGKTLHLAALMGNQGRIAAVESVRERFFRLRANLERCGAEMVRPYWMDGRAVGAKTPERFDRVLLDAPCSSEARFSRLDANSWAHWSPAKIPGGGPQAGPAAGVRQPGAAPRRASALLHLLLCAGRKRAGAGPAAGPGRCRTAFTAHPPGHAALPAGFDPVGRPRSASGPRPVSPHLAGRPRRWVFPGPVGEGAPPDLTRRGAARTKKPWTLLRISGILTILAISYIRNG